MKLVRYGRKFKDGDVAGSDSEDRWRFHERSDKRELRYEGMERNRRSLDW